MKKILVSLLVLVAFAMSFAVTNTVVSSTSFDSNGKPANVRIVPIAVTSTGAMDSLGPITTGSPHVYGPINLSVDPSRPMYTGFRVKWAGNAWTSGDSIALYYQILPTNKVSDTSSNWITLGANIALSDTIAYTSISGAAGSSIVFKLNPIDVTSVTFSKPIWVIFKEATEGRVDIKH